MRGSAKGYLFGLVAYLCWGLFPLYWKLLRPAGPVEVLAHRILWSLAFVAIVVAVTRRHRAVFALLRQPRQLTLIATAAVLIALNWGMYIYGVQADRVVETSLGYFINPLVTVLLGVLVLRERLRPAQWTAIGAGLIAVLVLAFDYGQPPYLALVLAFTFAGYGLVKKRLGIAAADGLFVESAVLALPALVFLLVLVQRGQSTFGHGSAGHTVLLIVGGAVTAVPLLLFAGAANRIPLSAIGLLQYVAPVLQLSCGVVIFHEPMPPGRLAGFALVWLALAIFSWDAVRHVRRTYARATPAVVAGVGAG